MTLRPLDIVAMGTTDYDITHYQELLYAAASFSQVSDVVGGFWDSCDDDSIEALRATAAAEGRQRPLTPGRRTLLPLRVLAPFAREQRA